jgi:RimJ/RimL family protein N-acetyltransferase
MSQTKDISGKVDLTPVVLEGEGVQLEPITMEHVPELAEVIFEPTIWRWMSTHMKNHDHLLDFVNVAIEQMKAGTAIVWVTRSKADGKVAGATRLFEISAQNHTMELGWTWLHPAYQRTGVNIEAKYLQLGHAFERMNAMRVAFKTHHENLKSQTAIAALGAKPEGVFRNHFIMPDGSIRHSVWYSITDDEWPLVKAKLKARLDRS